MADPTDVQATAFDALSFLNEFIEDAYTALDDADMRNINQVASLLHAFATGKREVQIQIVGPEAQS